MKNREVSLLLFYNSKNEILLQDRTSCSKSGEEWGFFGGGLEAGESAVEALAREIKEEMNITLDQIDEPIGIVKNTYFNKIQDCSVHIKRFIFVREYKNEGLEILEGAGSSWFQIDEAKRLKLVPGDIKVLELTEEYLNNRE